MAVIPVVCDEHTHEETSVYDSDKKMLDKMDCNVLATICKVDYFRNKVRISSLGPCKIIKAYSHNIYDLSNLITLGFK